LLNQRIQLYSLALLALLDLLICYMLNLGMVHAKSRPVRKPNTSIRVDKDILHQARIAAVTNKKTLGQWLEEAIMEKLEREQERIKER